MAWIGEIDLGTKPAPMTGPMVSLTIDDRTVQVPEGTSIPKLCATDTLESFGSCRLCLVEIDGRAGYPASCTTPVTPGMIVRTQTEKLKSLRRGVMELYISDHPLDCLTCSCERRLRVAGHGRRSGPARGALRL